jgi:hypothetical protein
VPRARALGDFEAGGFRFNVDSAMAPDGLHQLPQLDALARSWWKALERARSALRVAGPYLSWTELGERSSRLAEERISVARLLEELAHDLQANSRFVRSLAAPKSLQTAKRTQRGKPGHSAVATSKCFSLPSSPVRRLVSAHRDEHQKRKENHQ